MGRRHKVLSTQERIALLTQLYRSVIDKRIATGMRALEGELGLFDQDLQLEIQQWLRLHSCEVETPEDTQAKAKLTLLSAPLLIGIQIMRHCNVKSKSKKRRLLLGKLCKDLPPIIAEYERMRLALAVPKLLDQDLQLLAISLAETWENRSPRVALYPNDCCTVLREQFRRLNG